MALAASALCTVAVVADELDIDSKDLQTHRARLERYINAASSLIALILGAGKARQLHEAVVVVDVAGMDDPTLILPHTPIVSIAQVAIGDDVVDADEYEIANADAGFLLRIGGEWPSEMLGRGGVVTAGRFGTERKNIRVTYTAGWRTPAQGGTQTLPAALEDACVQLVSTRWRSRGKDLRVVAETHAGGNSYTFGGVGVPPEVMAALGPFVRIANA